MSTHQGKVSREIKDHIFLIGLDRVEKRNAFDSHMINDLSQALTEYENNDQLRCAIIFAHGDHFTAGLDLVELQPRMASGIFSDDPNIINPWGTSGRKRKKPVIVAVQGFCFTAGIELLLNADIAIAQDNTQFAQIEVQRGILPFGGATVRFVQAAGWSNAMRYLLTGDGFDATTAKSLNLITEITTEAPLTRALVLAQHIAKAAPLAVQATLAAAKDATSLNEQEAFQKLNQYLQPLLSTEDVQEGVMAMVQRREPKFQGK
ncbi:crotonase/enoyl-CoA hydratase family protein [Acinetobacter shaoyimingii]|uniref:Crotonase/enoyl-CoA hydratase family protein n=1 Tax=Acinetobacter shaoyimingii TaxID=2715164 RepID=A0A6G8RTV0_9GAMM|nr:crotonase/enoyl-CoA hydratase family protein [Acinetobacter shaoyimingii]NHB58863.1 crotonase/enoyl-CoA hydratase family protein [Acinetobacter shaoyimingii]QIO05250.1 crotonase/enoyl-CoA hydratase family protein [Acinetobacter shaoyimingii]